jgi:hypothetical protein
MVWFFKRDRASLSLETIYDNETLEYVAVVVHADGRRETERFHEREGFGVWLKAFEERLENERWAADGPVNVMLDGWPDKPPLM